MTHTLPPMENIGDNGEFEGLFEIIVIERIGERIFVAPNGTRLGRVVLGQPETQPVVPAIVAERVLGHDIRRIGMKHLEADLQPVRGLVTKMAEDLQRPLHMADLFGWSGEVSLAMCGEEGSVVYAVDSLTGNGRDAAIQRAAEIGTIELEELFKQNVGDRYGDTIKLVTREPAEVLATFEQCQDFDVVFVDTASDFSRLKAQIQDWMSQLNPETGILVGVNSDSDTVRSAMTHVFDNCPVVIDRMSSLWSVTAKDYLGAMFPATNA